jgi:hypothetical protein
MNRRAAIAVFNPTPCPSEVTQAANEVISILRAAEWLDTEISSYFRYPQPRRDRAYEQGQLAEFGAVRITAKGMRAEIRRLLVV